MEKDTEFMRLALEEASAALKEDHVPVGSVIVFNNNVIAKARNQVNSLNNPFAHAEMLAMQNVQQFLFKHPNTCTIYTTLEPCMMCLGAIINSRIARLVVAARTPVGALELLSLSKNYLGKAPEIVTGILERDSIFLLQGYVKRTGLRRDLLEP